MKNIALVYDGGIRDNGSPFYQRVGFTKVFGAELPWYTEANPIPEGHDFYLMLDDGRDDLHRLPPHPWGYYATDTHLGWESRYRKAKQADIIWCAQKPAAERMKAEGLNAHWLPLACEPHHHPSAAELGSPAPSRDLVFVGHMQDPAKSTRVDLLDALFRAHPNSWLAVGYFHQDMARIYHQARLGINHAIRDDLNMRFFELASMGVPQLCDRRMVGLADLGFMEGIHYLGYESPEEAVAVATEHLNGKHTLAARCAQSAYAVVRFAHTYEARVRTMLAQIEDGGWA